MKIKRINLFLSSLVMLSLLASCGGNKETKKDKYSFTYDLNYEGAPANRVVEIKANSRAGYWNAKRSGYTLDNWYTTKELDVAFDFKTLINKDTIVYAKWTKEVVKVPVSITFDYNYGDRVPTVVTGYKGETLSKDYAPNPDRLGFDVEGWYFDKEFTNQFKFNETILESDITLYAKYADVSNFTYDGEGNIVFNNVSFNLAINDSWVLSESFVKSLANKFNLAYKGKIKVNIITQATDNNNIITAKFHQTNIFNRSGDYHSIEDVLNLARVTFDKTQFYTDAINDCYYEGKLKSYPVAHIVPALVVNKNKLSQYFEPYKNEDKLPESNQDIIGALKAFAKAENKPALVTDDDWVFNENAANLPWSQNDAMLYKYDSATRKYYNDFVDANGNVSQNALNAVKSILDVFSSEGAIKGERNGMYGSGINEAYAKVKSGETLMGLASIPETVSFASDINNTLVMPVTNLFNVGNVTNTKNFIGNYSFGVTSSGPDDLYKKAAAGVFIDWFSKNAEKISDLGLVPARKSVFEGYFQTSTNTTSIRTRSLVGDPNKLITLPGTWSEWSIFNNKDNQYLQSIIDLGTYDEELAKSFLIMLSESINGLLS